MRTKLQARMKQLAIETHAAEIAEAAAVLPIMFMILLGIFWFGQAFSIYGAITRAAQEGARAASVAYCATCPGTNTLAIYDQNGAAAIQTALQDSKLDPKQAQYPKPIPTLLSCSSGSTILCDGGASSNFCIQSPVQLTASGPGATGLCGVSVTFQYPYTFWLPFTSIGNQKIYISASSRIRLETR